MHSSFRKTFTVYSTLLLVSLVTGVVSCVHELPAPVDPGTPTTPVTPPPTTQLGNCNADTVYFANTILPIINTVCGKVGCHGATSPGAFSLYTYSAISYRLGTSNRLKNALQDMAEKKTERPSLAYTPPSSDQMALIQKWISQGSKNNSCTSGCDTTQFTYAAIISPLLTLHCTGCHTGASAGAGVDLSSYANVKAELTANPGRLLGSIQWVAPYTGTKQMPLSQSKLPDCNITQVKKWIAAGALNN